MTKIEISGIYKTNIIWNDKPTITIISIKLIKISTAQLNA